MGVNNVSRLADRVVAGTSLMGLGDSILGSGWSASKPAAAIDGRAILGWASLYSQGKLTLFCPTGLGPAMFNGGITSAEAMATYLPLILAAKPGLCAVILGANDFAQSVPLATTLSNMRTIFGALNNAGIVPIVCAHPPRQGPPVNLRAYNVWLADYARINGYPFADCFSPVVDRTTAGTYLAANTNDGGGHPSQAGAKLMGQAIANAVVNLPLATAPIAQVNTVLGGDTIDRWGVATNNSLHLVDTNADGTPDGYSVPSSGTSDLGTSASQGKFCTLTRAATDNAIRITTALSGISLGDRLLMAVELYSAVKGVAGDVSLYLDLQSDGAQLQAGFAHFGEDIPAGSVWSQEFTFTGSTTDPRIEIFANVAAGAKIGFGRGVLLNLTAAGVSVT